MRIYTYKVCEKDLRSIHELEETLNNLLMEINPRIEDCVVALDYSGINYSPLTTVTGIAISRLIGAGFRKVIITGARDKEGIRKQPAGDFYMSRGQLEIS